ncbi:MULTISPECIES: ABC transporter ATP-binding protein [unclassified Frankia]|uniref:ABC transporter ATP-binding protein n=1 Tax=unclassified Frankia TaxID=2632575 RepID=UPI001EF6875C|nr:MULTISPECIES: ABC transporter ATP-binding protein [unclassified Frankia]
MTAPAILDVDDLWVAVGATAVVRGISFALSAGQRLGIVGESGSGKTLTALAVMGLHRGPVRVTGGRVWLDGIDLLVLRRRELDRIRGRRISMIYQDPAAALNPLMTIGAQIVESIRLHEDVRRASALERAADLLGEVGIPAPRQRLAAYPHEFSGGMRQRAMIAMALASRPDVLLCDEPTSALDVTTQVRVIALIDRICRERGLAAVLITHDLGVAAGFCDDTAVMYAGQIVESAPTVDLYARPAHPYSAALMSATVDLTVDLTVPIRTISGQPPLPAETGAGCAFQPRCPISIGLCAEPVALRAAAGRQVRCVRAGESISAEYPVAEHPAAGRAASADRADR